MFNAKSNSKKEFNSVFKSGKNLFQITIVAAALAFSSCSSTGPATSGKSYDDVYGSSSANNNTVSQPQHANPSDYTSAAPQYNPDETNANSQNPDSRFEYGNTNETPSTTSSNSDGHGNTYVTNNYYNNDDYYDYAYSARINRFYHPYGWGYYDPYYTNSYMYDHNPYSWNVSIYLGYNWWAPSYAYYSPFSWGVGFSYGYPMYGYGGYYPYYPAYGYGGCGGCGGCGSCGGGCGGYNSCYNNNPYYYNSYDNTCSSNSSYYYGPHRSTGSNHQSGITPHSVAQLYEEKVLKVSDPNTAPDANVSAVNYSSVPRPKNVMSSASEVAVPKSNSIKNNPKSIYSTPKPINKATVKTGSSTNTYSNPHPKNNNNVSTPKSNTQSVPGPKNDLNNDQPKNNYEQPVMPKEEYHSSTPKENSVSEPRPAKKHWWMPKSFESHSTNNSAPSEPKGHDSYSTPKQNSSSPAPSYSQPKQQQSQPRNDNSGSGSRHR